MTVLDTRPAARMPGFQSEHAELSKLQERRQAIEEKRAALLDMTPDVYLTDATRRYSPKHAACRATRSVGTTDATMPASPIAISAITNPEFVLPRSVLDWHVSNLEFANATTLDTLSLQHWDQARRHSPCQSSLAGNCCMLRVDGLRLLAHSHICALHARTRTCACAYIRIHVLTHSCTRMHNCTRMPAPVAPPAPTAALLFRMRRTTSMSLVAPTLLCAKASLHCPRH